MRSRDLVVLLEPAVTSDEYGQPAYDWEAANSRVCAATVQSTGSTEATVTDSTVTTRATAWLPSTGFGALVEPHWRVVWRGQAYEIDGDILDWRQGRRDRHRVCNLKRVTTWSR